MLENACIIESKNQVKLVMLPAVGRITDNKDGAVVGKWFIYRLKDNYTDRLIQTLCVGM